MLVGISFSLHLVLKIITIVLELWCAVKLRFFFQLLTSLCFLKSVFEYGIMLSKKQGIVFALLHGFA